MRLLVLLLLVVSGCLSLEVHRFGPGDALFTAVIVCGLHPREAITRDVCDDWVSLLKQKPLNKMQIVVVPNANPSGMSRWREDECWRGNGRGVDLNRNWPPIACDLSPYNPDLARVALYDEEDATHEKEWSHGQDPLSEEETQELHNLLDETRPHLLLSVHSGIEAFLTPYDRCVYTPHNYRDHIKLAKWLRRDVCDQCVVARSSRLLYVSEGTMTDYAYHVLNVPLVMTVEIYAGEETDDVSRCAQLFSPPENTLSRVMIVRRWRKMMERLINIDGDDFLALLEMSGIVEPE